MVRLTEGQRDVLEGDDDDDSGGGGGGGSSAPSPERDTSPDRSGAGPTEEEIERREQAEALEYPESDVPGDNGGGGSSGGGSTDVPTPEEDTSPIRSGAGPTPEELRGRDIFEAAPSPERDRAPGPGAPNLPGRGVETGRTARGNRVTAGIAAQASAFEDHLIQEIPEIQLGSDVAVRYRDGRLEAELTGQPGARILGAQQKQFRESVESQVGTDLPPGSVERRGDEFAISERGASAIERAMLGDGTDQQAGQGLGVTTDPGPSIDVGEIPDAPPRQFAGQQTVAPRGEDILGGGGFGAGAASEVTPSKRMTLGGGGPGFQARARREELFAERAERGAADIADLQLPSLKETGAMWFQGAEIAERQLVGAGRALSEANPFAGVGPGLTESESVGDIPGMGAEFLAGTAGGLVGSIGQAPVTITADVTRDAVAETEELEAPPGELAAPEEVSQDATPGDIEQQVAEMNPGVDRSDIDVTRSAGGEFGIDADLSEQDLRERVAAENPGTDPEDIWFTEEGAPMATTLAEGGQTPTEMQGGTLATAEETAEAQIDLAAEYPLTTATLFALPAAETAGRFRTGLAEGRAGSRVVRAESITTEAGAQGEIPTSESFRSGSSREAVREIRERAADQPDAVQEAAGVEELVYHTSPERLGQETIHAEGATGVGDLLTGRQPSGRRALEVGEGASELPGLFTSPEMNPVGLRSTNIAGRSASLREYLQPRMPDLGGSPDRIAALEGDRVAAMPERAAGQGYEVRGSGGERLEGGLGRGEAKARAADIEGADVAPDTTTAGYEFLAEEATPGTSYVKPSATRSAEIESIFPPGSEFIQRGRGPDVQFGGRIIDVPRTDIQLTFGGERVPMDIFSRAGESARRGAEAPETRATAEGIAERSVSLEEAAQRASSRQGPAAPSAPVSPTATEAGTSAPSEPTSPADATRPISDPGEPLTETTGTATEGVTETSGVSLTSPITSTGVSEPTRTTGTTTPTSRTPTTPPTTPTTPGPESTIPTTPTTPGPGAPPTGRFDGDVDEDRQFDFGLGGEFAKEFETPIADPGTVLSGDLDALGEPAPAPERSLGERGPEITSISGDPTEEDLGRLDDLKLGLD